MWDELSFIKLKLGRVGMGRVLHLGPGWHGPIFKWAELAWAELVLGRVVLHPKDAGCAGNKITAFKDNQGWAANFTMAFPDMENKAQAEILANMIFSRKKLQIRECGSSGARGPRFFLRPRRKHFSV